jgi:hypothetical protein
MLIRFRDLEIILTMDGKNLDPGSGINILDPQHWLTVLFHMYLILFLFECSPILFVSSFRTRNVHYLFNEIISPY